jgi:hypothetical protein
MELCDDVDSDLAAKETEGLACKGAIAALDNPGSVFAGAYSVARKGPVASRSVRQQTRGASPRPRLRFADAYSGTVRECATVVFDGIGSAFA